MARFDAQLIGRAQEGIGLGLQHAATTLFGFGRALGQPSEERIHLLTRFGSRAEAGVRSGFLAKPGTGRVHHCCCAAQHPLAAQVHIGTEVRFVHKESLAPLTCASLRKAT